jgi:hypothetical protein
MREDWLCFRRPIDEGELLPSFSFGCARIPLGGLAARFAFALPALRVNPRKAPNVNSNEPTTTLCRC